MVRLDALFDIAAARGRDGVWPNTSTDKLLDLVNTGTSSIICRDLEALLSNVNEMVELYGMIICYLSC